MKTTKPCPVCGSKWINKHKEVIDDFNHMEEIYEERCASCSNLLYGYSKPK